MDRQNIRINGKLYRLVADKLATDGYRWYEPNDDGIKPWKEISPLSRSNLIKHILTMDRLVNNPIGGSNDNPSFRTIDGFVDDAQISAKGVNKNTTM